MSEPVSDRAELAARIAALEDIAAIRDLKARYLRACDLRQPEIVLDTLLPEGALIAYEGFPEFRDRESFVAVFRQMGCQPGIHDMHHASNGVVRLTGPDSACGEWSLHFHSINLAARTVTQMGVEYDDRYLRRDGRWWIAQTRTRRTSCLIEQIDADGAARIIALGEAPAMPT